MKILSLGSPVTKICHAALEGDAKLQHVLEQTTNCFISESLKMVKNNLMLLFL
jgi:hypothetical protein